MTPYFPEGLCQIQPDVLPGFLEALGLAPQLFSYRASYGSPLEIGAPQGNISVVLIEPVMRHDHRDVSSGVFEVWKPDEGGRDFHYRPDTRNHYGRKIEGPHHLIIEPIKDPSGKVLKTIARIGTEFMGIARMGFSRVSFWNPETRSFVQAQKGDSTELEGGVVLFPDLEEGSGESEVKVFPISEVWHYRVRENTYQLKEQLL